MIRQYLTRFRSTLWCLLILLLPITSMPLVAKLVRSDAVAAPSGVILLILLIVWGLPYLKNGGSFPAHIKPLLWFFVAALFSTAMSTFMPIPVFKTQSPWAAQFSALVTLVIGIAFYSIASSFPARSALLSKTLWWINWSGFCLICWASLQAIVWFSFNRYPDWLRSIHEVYSLGPLFRQRVVGFALEPSWLAHQLNLLYLPFWLSATVYRFSVHRFRLGPLTFENMLLAGGAGILLLTFSRVGMLGAILMLAYLLIRASGRIRPTLILFFSCAWPKLKDLERERNIWISAALWVLIALTYTGLVILLGVILSRVDPRMNALFKFDLQQENPLLHYAKQLNIAARLVYWQAGWQVFNDFPIRGVGLGNAGFFLPGSLSTEAFALTEVRHLLYRTQLLLNIKSLWVRILAETGVIGFAVFTSWIWVNLKSAFALERSTDHLIKVIGLAGVLVVVGLIVEGFSLDSFAMPYFWVSLGLVCAALSVEHGPKIELSEEVM